MALAFMVLDWLRKATLDRRSLKAPCYRAMVGTLLYPGSWIVVVRIIRQKKLRSDGSVYLVSLGISNGKFTEESRKMVYKYEINISPPRELWRHFRPPGSYDVTEGKILKFRFVDSFFQIPWHICKKKRLCTVNTQSNPTSSYNACDYIKKIRRVLKIPIIYYHKVCRRRTNEEDNEGKPSWL